MCSLTGDCGREETTAVWYNRNSPSKRENPDMGTCIFVLGHCEGCFYLLWVVFALIGCSKYDFMKMMFKCIMHS